MTYREHMHGLAAAVGELVRDGAQVGPADLDAALTAHAAAVELLRTVYTSVTHVMSSPYDDTTLAGLERHPVAVLGKLLRSQPTEHAAALSDVVSGRPLDRSAQAWRHVARHATVARHEWTVAEPTTLPRRDAAWSEVADVAALSEALAAVTGDLATSARNAGQLQIVEKLAIAGASGLGRAARAVADLAAAGPTPPAGELALLPQRRVLVIHSVDDVPAALHRLAHLVGTADEISPSRVQLIAQALAGASQAGARSLAVVGAPHQDLVMALDQQTQALAAVASAPRRVAALAPGDEAAVEQAHQIHQVLAAAKRRGQMLPEPLAVDVARGAAEATRAASVAVRSQVSTGRWLTPADGAEPGSFTWQAVRDAGLEPSLVREARVAGLRARMAADRLPAASEATAWSAPREVLAEALNHRSVERPARPSQPKLAVPLRR